MPSNIMVVRNDHMSRTKHHGDKAKKKTFGLDWHWMSTPAWWIRLVMNRPQRRAVHLWEREAVTSTDIEEVDTPPHGRKPHVYYW